MKIKLFISLLTLIISNSLYGQQIPLPANLSKEHPRLLTTSKEKATLQQKIENENWAKEVKEGLILRVEPYLKKVKEQPDWLLSRLMMYWKSHADQVYINGGLYARATGEAPVPTIRFGSTRGISSPIKRPKLENIIPYMDDTKGVFFLNTAKPDSPLEWVDQVAVSGSSIESVNNEIIGLGRDAAFLFWLTGEEKYAKLAFGVFDTYMTGMYYMKEPIDQGNGHAQTLVGMSTFEVIQEKILPELAIYYDFLYAYIKSTHEDKLAIYEQAFKKWIDVTIKHGVPHNNWNLHQASLMLPAIMVLADDNEYTDGRGRSYYLNCILNKTSARQWALTKLMNYGYDKETGVWNESPGYAQSVTSLFMEFIHRYDNTFNQNLLPYAPVMKKAVAVLPQYLFPNQLTTAFGDSYYGDIASSPIADMIKLSQKYADAKNEELFTGLYKKFVGAEPIGDGKGNLPIAIQSFFTNKPLVLKKDIVPANLKDFVTPTFYAPNVSWFVQRSKYDSKENGLMISQYASYGNHAHSNGVAMELYGKGYVLGAESGIGSSYFEKPYLEYYSQFPAHNTVMVDGISTYPEMLSNHPFDLLANYPASGKKEGYFPGVTYSDVYFLEPESRSDQNRLLSIVNTGDSTGYYVDIFRSKKQGTGDKFHDYFYHNLGQDLFIKDASDRDLRLEPSEEMAFAGGHLFALDYMWDKRSAKTNKDYQAVWKMTQPNGNHVYMNLWMKGYEGREVFAIKAPQVKSFRSNDGFPYDLKSSPFLTIAARQHGEAWNHPFVSIFEPSTEKNGKSIVSITSFEVNNASPDFVGLIVKSKSGRNDYIFSSVKEEDVVYRDMRANGTYVVLSEEGNDFTLFLGHGKLLAAKGFTISADQPSNATLRYEHGMYYFTCDRPVVLTMPNGKRIKIEAQDYDTLSLK
ncbi:hypothetical protein [Olivibacter domesticus]|uniref:Heparinase II/III-like protein n=1 Tax=Olivibacter domesticus TaxID=407022 RepID=A0A1H7GIE0_OLID1|nr:hypothetical protein [Olivibacter domesticus]SEK36722.1 hypothetical protein SAMN05661044_00065 [Olivibacter domesticus]